MFEGQVLGFLVRKVVVGVAEKGAVFVAEHPWIPGSEEITRGLLGIGLKARFEPAGELSLKVGRQEEVEES